MDPICAKTFQEAMTFDRLIDHPNRKTRPKGAIMAARAYSQFIHLTARRLAMLHRERQANEGFWCLTHDREATARDNNGCPCCDRKLGGILLPCRTAPWVRLKEKPRNQELL